MVDHCGVICRHELTDQEWELLAPLIPRAVTGRPRVSDRQVVNGMVYKIRTGISWRDHCSPCPATSAEGRAAASPHPREPVWE
ncbi:transposase [Streptomyces sp. NPDC050997]|uniref:transposase n=1 Tax=Streptomyces sp. NPDC050997 TaxID=3155519 RepID=UPI00341E776B